MNNRIYKRLEERDFSELIKMSIKDFNFDAKGFGIYDVNNNPKENANKRYYLEIDRNGNKQNTLVAILMNPANTFPDLGFDKTIQNVIKIAKKKNIKNWLF